jgi:hypothetical protein
MVPQLRNRSAVWIPGTLDRVVFLVKQVIMQY